METRAQLLSPTVVIFGVLLGLACPFLGYADIGRDRRPAVSAPVPQVTPTRPAWRTTLLPVIARLARHYDVDARLVRAIIHVESRFNPGAVSPTGAQGLMQLMPATAARYEVDDPFDPHANIAGGIRYLRDLFQLFPGDLQRVLAAYNAGEAAVQRYGGVPPYPETQHYVAQVLTLYGEDTGSQKIYRYQTASGSILFTNVPR